MHRAVQTADAVVVIVVHEFQFSNSRCGINISREATSPGVLNGNSMEKLRFRMQLYFITSLRDKKTNSTSSNFQSLFHIHASFKFCSINSATDTVKHLYCFTVIINGAVDDIEYSRPLLCVTCK